MQQALYIKSPLNPFVCKLCLWFVLNISLEMKCSHIAGKNDNADFLSC